MPSGLFIMRLSPEERRLLSTAAKATGLTQAELVRSILFPVLASMKAERTAMVNSDTLEELWTHLSQGKTAEDVKLEKQLLAEEEAFWSNASRPDTSSLDLSGQEINDRGGTKEV